MIRELIELVRNLITKKEQKYEIDKNEYDEVYMKELEYGHEYKSEENIKSYSEMTDEELSEITDELYEQYKDVM